MTHTLERPSRRARVHPTGMVACTIVLALLCCACGGGDEPTPPMSKSTEGASPEMTAAKTGSGPLPEKLSEAGLFEDMKTLAPAEGVFTYTVRNPRWHDGTDQVRHARLPEGGKIEVDDAGEFVFPEGTVLAWTCFTKGANPTGRSHARVETRVSRRLKSKGRWELVNYAWNAAGDEATRLSPKGEVADFKLPGVDTPYEYVGRVQCIQCHNGGLDRVLGLSAWQVTDETLKTLTDHGHLPVEAALPHAKYQGGSDVENQLLGYLAGNCTFCHMPRSASFMQNHLDLRHWNAKKNLVGKVGTRFTSREAPNLVTAGDPDKSMIVKLFDRTYAPHDPNRRMPPIGNAVVDQEALALLKKWIAGLQ